MKTIIAGSRSIRSIIHIVTAIRDAAKEGIIPTEIVSGCAAGVDTLGETWAADHKIPVARFPADWGNIERPGAVIRRGWDGKPYDVLAGFIRNQQMADYAEALILVWDGKSTGSRDMLERAKKRGIRIYVHEVKP